MSVSMTVPASWLSEAGLQGFVPTRQAFRCDEPHIIISIANIEKMIRSVPLDMNGFRRDRMMRVLTGIRDDDALPPIPVQRADQGPLPYRLRDGTHRFYASLALGFSHIPAVLVEY